MNRILRIDRICVQREERRLLSCIVRVTFTEVYLLTKIGNHAVTTKETDDENKYRNLANRRCIVYCTVSSTVKERCAKKLRNLRSQNIREDICEDICERFVYPNVFILRTRSTNENGYGIRKFSYEEKVKYLYCAYCIYFILLGSRSIFAARKQSNLFCVLRVKKLFYFAWKEKVLYVNYLKYFIEKKHH